MVDFLTRTPAGEKLLETALYFANDGEFMNAGVGINRPDNFNNLFTGMFTARVTGDYQFQMYQRDDRGTFWVDLNRNGLFEQNGSAGNEWMNNGYGDGMSTVRLSPGNYRFAIGHTEHGGNSRIHARFSTPHPSAGPTSLTTIDPTEKNQAGLWVVEYPLNTGVKLSTVLHTLQLTQQGILHPSHEWSKWSPSIRNLSSPSRDELSCSMNNTPSL